MAIFVILPIFFMQSTRKSSNKRRVSIKRRGIFVANVLGQNDISIQLFTQLNSTQLLLLLLSHAGTPPNAGGIYRLFE